MQVKAISATGAASAAPQDKASLEKAAHQFEAIFLRQMMGAMRSASLGEGMLDSAATDQFRDMADARTADSMADKGTLGIADMLLQQFGAKMAPAVAHGPKSAKSDGA